MEGPIFGGVYLRREICVSKSIGLAFALFYFVFGGNFPSTSPRGAYIWRGDLTEGFLRYRFWRGLYMEGIIFGILRYFPHSTFLHGRGSLLEKGYEITGENDE